MSRPLTGQFFYDIFDYNNPGKEAIVLLIKCVVKCPKKCPIKDLISTKNQIIEAFKLGGGVQKKRKFKDLDILEVKKLINRYVDQMDIIIQTLNCPKWQKLSVQEQTVIIVTICSFIEGIISIAEKIEGGGEKKCQKKGKAA